MKRIFLPLLFLLLFFTLYIPSVYAATTPTPTTPPGTCEWLPGPPLEPRSHCNAGFEPAIKPGSSPLAPECICKTAGSGGTFTGVTPVPSETPIPPGLPCSKPVGSECKAVNTAIGDISTDPVEFIQFIFTVLLSMSGGWAVYLIMTAGYQLMFSQGEAEGVKEAQEKITSAVVGIVFMLLSLIILRVIGVDIFKLPTFG